MRKNQLQVLKRNVEKRQEENHPDAIKQREFEKQMEELAMSEQIDNVHAKIRATKERSEKIQNTILYTHIFDDVEVDVKRDMREGIDGGRNDDKVIQYLEVIKHQDPKINVIPTMNAVSGLVKLKEQFPNFIQVIDFLVKYTTFKALKGEPIKIPPINLQGEPGIGKTYFSQKIAEALGTEQLNIDISQLMSAHELLGLSSRWADPEIGIILSRLFEDTQYAQPIVLIDELCRAPKGAGKTPSLYNAMLKILDQKTSKKVKDNFLDIHYDASNPIYISTTNNWEELPEALKSRITNFNIEKPNDEEYTVIINHIYRELLEAHNVTYNFQKYLNEDVIMLLAKTDLRTARSIIESSVITCFLRMSKKGRKKKFAVSVEDIKNNHSHIIEGKKKRTMGFI